MMMGNLDFAAPASNILVCIPSCARRRKIYSGLPMYEAKTRDIKVTVEPSYLENQSSPLEDHYVWAYHIRIENTGAETVQLRTRHWRITDAAGRTEEVQGPGVVGEQPVLTPGESFEYSSGAPLEYSKLSPGVRTGCSPTTPGPCTSSVRPAASVIRQWRVRS